MRRAARADENQAHIVAALRAVGLRVAVTHRLGEGFPDLVVGGHDLRADAAKIVLVEIKSDGGQLTPDEAQFFEAWAGLPVIVARSAESVLREFGRI